MMASSIKMAFGLSSLLALMMHSVVDASASQVEETISGFVDDSHRVFTAPYIVDSVLLDMPLKMARTFAPPADYTEYYQSILTDDPMNIFQYYLRVDELHSISNEQWSKYGDYAGVDAWGAQAVIKEHIPSGPVAIPRVLVIDGGFVPTEDVVFVEGKNFINPQINVNLSIDYVDDNYRFVSEECADTDTHGISMAGIIGATQDNGIWMAGITNYVELVAARVMDCGIGYSEAMARAVLYGAGYVASDHDAPINNGDIPAISRPVDVINLSVSGPSYTCPESLQHAIDYAHSQGIAVVVGAGNRRSPAEQAYPGNCNNVIVASGTGLDHNSIWSNANVGSNVTVYAPAVFIVPNWSNPDIDNPYFLSEGTSNATAIVSATIAMLKQIRPEMTPLEAAQILQTSARTFRANTSMLDGSEKEVTSYALHARRAVEEALWQLPAPSQTSEQTFNGEITHALSNIPVCYHDMLIESESANSVCDMVEITFSQNNIVNDYIKYRLLNADTAEVIVETTDNSMVFDKTLLDESVQYHAERCLNVDGEPQCTAMLHPVKMDIAEVSACQ